MEIPDGQVQQASSCYIREQQNTEADHLEIAVAKDAPATPISSPKIKIGSRIQFRMPPKPIPIMDSVALPSDRRHWFITKLVAIKGAANST